jgi:hypothetical protein
MKVVVDDGHSAAADAITTSILGLVVPDPGIIGNLGAFLDNAPSGPDILPDFCPLEDNGFKQFRSFADDHPVGEH